MDVGVCAFVGVCCSSSVVISVDAVVIIVEIHETAPIWDLFLGVKALILESFSLRFCLIDVLF